MPTPKQNLIEKIKEVLPCEKEWKDDIGMSESDNGYNKALSDIDPQKLLSVIITEIKKEIEEKIDEYKWEDEGYNENVTKLDILILLDNYIK